MTWLIALGGLSAGIFGGLTMAIVEIGAWFLVSPRPLAETEADASSLARSAEPMRVKADDGAMLAGLWLPSPQSSGKIMILVHGFMDGPSAMIADRGEALLARGWSVAAIALRAHGPSGGMVSGFGALEAADLRVWLDAIADLIPPGESLAPVVWGRSMGAAIALRAAVEDPRIQALVLEAPLVDLEEVVASRLRKRWIAPARLFARWIVKRAGRLAGASLRRPRPLNLAPRLSIPVVVIHGTDDALVPSSSARMLAAAFPAPASFLEVPGAGHADVAAVGGPLLLGQILDLIDDRLENREEPVLD